VNPAVCVADIRRIIGAVKTEARDFGTNFFLPDAVIEPSIRAGHFFVLEAAGAALALLREARFDRVYYSAAGASCLAGCLSRLSMPDSGALVTDIVGRPEDSARWVQQFEAAGFSPYTRFLRMQRIFSGTLPQAGLDPEVEVAQASDAQPVLDAIAENFDPYAEHFPAIEEIRQALSLGTILLARDAGRVAAMLYYDRSGLTSMLRYWLVLPAYRRHGLGDKLMRRYFQDCAGCRRFILWVQETNQRAVPIYRWYGYQPDSTVDTILIKRR
jgi:GNAT superfamily N-acetyltransferase